ncbi:MAG: hypothetical protein AB1659_12135, partial [Thermodesulfobacteriota bacterium]
MNKRIRIGIGAVLGAVILAAGYLGISHYLEVLAGRKVDDIIQKTSGFMDIGYRHVDVDFIGWNTHIRGVTLSPVGETEKIGIEDIAVYRIREHRDGSLDVQMALNGIRIKGEDLSQDGQALDVLGYREIKADMEIDFRYHGEKKELNLKTLRLGAEGMGDAEFSLDLSNFELDPEKGILILFMIPRIQIHKARIAYTDDSLVKRIIRLIAKKEGRTPE